MMKGTRSSAVTRGGGHSAGGGRGGVYISRLVYAALCACVLYPLTSLFADRLGDGVPYYSLMLTFIPAVFFVPAFRFKKRFGGFVVRLAYSLLVGLVVFNATPILFRIVAVLFVFGFTSMLDIANNEPSVVGAICGIMVVLNLIFGYMLYRTPMFNDYSYVFDHSIYVSVFAILTFFILFRVDNARYFGDDQLRIPLVMKRHTALIIIACGALVVLTGPLMPYIANFVEFVLRYVAGGIAAILAAAMNAFLAVLPEGNGQINPEDAVDIGMPEIEIDAGEPVVFPEWLVFTVVIVVFGTLIIAVLYQLYRGLRILYRYLMQRTKMRESETDAGYTEVIEMIDAEHGAPSSGSRRFKPRGRYPAHASERERVLFIYREYVKRAKRAELTGAYPDNTASEILCEIGDLASGSAFPQPEGLGDAYNAAGYGHENTVIRGADDLRKRLL